MKTTAVLRILIGSIALLLAAPALHTTIETEVARYRGFTFDLFNAAEIAGRFDEVNLFDAAEVLGSFDAVNLPELTGDLQ